MQSCNVSESVLNFHLGSSYFKIQVRYFEIENKTNEQTNKSVIETK